MHKLNTAGIPGMSSVTIFQSDHFVLSTNLLFKFNVSSIPYVQGVSEPISGILTQVGIGVALKPHHTLSSLFRKPKDVINFE